LIPVVMAGGFGTRIRPLSANRPKPMLPVVNVPILERLLLQLASHDMREAVLLVYHDPGKIREAFRDGRRLGMKLHYYQADQDYGTAGAVAHGADLVRSDIYLVLSSDVICDFDLAAIAKFHRDQAAKVTISLTHVPNPLQFGIVITDADGRVRRFLEKPTWGEVFSDTVNTGIYVLDADVLEQVPRTETMDFSRELFPRFLAAGAPIYGHISEGYWRDIGDPESYLAAHLDFFSGTLRIVPPGQLRALGGKPVWCLGEPEVDQSAEVRGTVVMADGCRVGPGVRLEDVVLGPGTVVEGRAELRRSVTWDHVQVGEGARIEGAVLGSRVTVGAETVVETGAVIADDTQLGREVRLKEGVKIWPAKIVEDHAVVHSNLVYAERWRTSAFEEGAVTGLTNLELTPEVAARLGAAYGSLLQPGNTILTSRDAHPASRMLRRAFVGGVGSTGVHVVDGRLLPVPVMRHKLEGFGEHGGVAFQQAQSVRGMTSIRFFDDRGLDISTSFAKSVERVFLREEFRRVNHQEVGSIYELPRLVDFYAEAYLKAIDVDAIRTRRFRLVVDYSHSAAVVVLPRLLEELGCDVVTLNAHIEGVHEALLAEQIERSQDRLAKIVVSLDADLGVWLLPGGERLVLADRNHKVWKDFDLVALVIAALVAAKVPGGETVLPVYAPSTFSTVLAEAGHRVRETLSASRALTEASRRRSVLFASSGEGDLIFPALHHFPDALFGLGSLLELLAHCGATIEEVASLAPAVAVVHQSLPCPLERKGRVMRRFAEQSPDAGASFLEGIKLNVDDGWVLMRPDRVTPQLHLHAEGPTAEAAERILMKYRKLVDRLVRSA
jgi:mannose-1-phosphate guanylyltransferase/phosphomannomutase